MNDLELIVTSDGSHSLLNRDLDETYHSRHGAIQESVHVFIKQGLHYVLQQPDVRSVSILEIGFGTGLNALLTAREAAGTPIDIQYCSLEAFPVKEEIWSRLNYADSPVDKELFDKLHQGPWSATENVLPNFRLLKLPVTLQQVQLTDNTFNLIYFDAFAPNKQPEMWEFTMLEKVARAMTPQGIFVTYCAKGQLKRDLRALGFEVETLAGPPGKKEMVRAKKMSS